MASIRLRSLAPAISCVLIALGPPAVSHANASTLPTGHAKGVSVLVHKHTVDFRFGRYTDLTVRYLASGRRVELTCTHLGSLRLDRYRPAVIDGDTLRAPRHIRDLRLKRIAASAPSFCSVWQVAPVRRTLVDIPVTEDGAIYLDERRTFQTITNAATTAAMDAQDAGRATFAPTDQLVTDWNHGNLGTAVALQRPEDTPPPGKLGLFSDSAHHFVAVKLTTLGHRMFYDINGEVVATNAETYAP